MSLLKTRRAAKRRSETISLFALLSCVLSCVIGAAIGASTNDVVLMWAGGTPGFVGLVAWMIVYRP